uniref:Matrin-type domain-containing protein n=1 Tax=Triticum urartu TaxID=4572 RepID=A0A8R7V1F8_TRIUA
MTEYWVSQGNKWCDLCKIFISNNPFSIRTHELGKRHKDNVTQRLSTMQKDGAAKEKEQQQAAKALQLIEAKAKKSYQKDLENNQRNTDGDSSAAPGEVPSLTATSQQDNVIAEPRNNLLSARRSAIAWNLVALEHPPRRSFVSY